MCATKFNTPVPTASCGIFQTIESEVEANSIRVKNMKWNTQFSVTKDVFHHLLKLLMTAVEFS